MSGLAALLAGRRAPGIYRWDSHLPLADVAHAVDHAKWHAFVLDGLAVTGAQDFLVAIGGACEFPDNYEPTWDDVASCLRDLSWVERAKGRVLVYEGWEMLALTDADAWAAAYEVLSEAVDEWAESETPFAVLLRGHGSAVPTFGIPELV